MVITNKQKLPRLIKRALILSYSVDDLLILSDKYDFAIVRQKCVEFLSDLKDDMFFQLRMADKHELAKVEVIIPIYFSSDY